jgi:hypothetical protein
LGLVVALWIMRYHVISICLKRCPARLSLRMLSLGEIVEEDIIRSTMVAVLASAVARSVLATASSVLPFSRCTAAIKTFHLIRVS